MKKTLVFAVLLLSLHVFGATEFQGARELKSQLQTLKERIRQLAAKPESGLTAAQIAGLESRIKSSVPEINSIMHEIQSIAQQAKVAAGPGLGNMALINRSSLLNYMDMATRDILTTFIKLNVEDKPKENAGDLNQSMLALIARMNKLVGNIYNPSGLTPRETHEPSDLVLDSLTNTNDGRISITMHNQGGAISNVQFNASYVKVTVNDTVEKSIYFTDIDPNGLLKLEKIATGNGANLISLTYIWPGTGPNGITLAPGHTYKVNVVLDFNVRISDSDRSNNAKTLYLHMTP